MIIIGTAMLIRLSEGMILGIRCAKGRGVILPGGKVDLGETFRQAAIRECQEETGITVHPDRARLVFHAFSTDQSYCYTYEAVMVDQNQLAGMLGSNLGSGKIGVHHYTEFLSSDYKAYYEILFQTVGIME